MPNDYSSPLIPDRSDDGGFIDPRMMRRLTAQLQARDERERMARLGRAGDARFEAAGPEPQSIQPSPRGTFPVMRGEAAPSRPATMMVPSRSTYDMMSPIEQEMSTFGGVGRGILATGLAGAALMPASLGYRAPLISVAEDAGVGALVGGTAGLGAFAPYGVLSNASDRMAGRLNPTSPTAGRFAPPGPRIQDELRHSYLPEQPWTQRMGISGETLAPASIEAAGERVAARRAQERAAEDEAIAARRQETNAYWSERINFDIGDRTAEAARQRRLEDTFGTAEDRARQIMQLEASRFRGNGR